MQYSIKIDKFEGPLDLLLHLIKESNINIYEIKISEITMQYLEYIKAMETLNLSIASEYLVMAAELLEMKSRTLLPSSVADDPDLIEENPEDALIRRLLDYQNYKEITKTFRELEKARSLIFTKGPTSIEEYRVEAEIQEPHSVSLLLEAFSRFIDRNELHKPIHTRIATREMSLSERVSSIRNILKRKKIVKFEDLFEEYTKEYFVITFLSILQMAKEQEIDIKQDSSFEQIYIKLKG